MIQPQPDPESDADASMLASGLAALLPEARLVATQLPLLPEIRLWLLGPDYPAGPLPARVASTLLDSPPYWAFCWGAGAVLARWLLDNPASVRGRKVLDFGAGSGVVAIAAALAGAKQSIACDLDPKSLAASRANARLNGVQVQTCDDFFRCREPVDLLAAADVLYDRDNLALLPCFRERAPAVLVADSRVRDFAEPGYLRLWAGDCTAMPDLGESAWFRRVTVYAAGAAIVGMAGSGGS